MIRKTSKIKHSSVLIALSGMLLISLISSGAYADSSNEIQYSGTLIALPCTVDPSFENMWVDFGGNINAKDLAKGQRRYSKEDILFNLKDCDTSLGNTISARFTGISTTDNGLLNVDAGSQASGIVVGLEAPSGLALPINNSQVGSIIPIKDGDMTIRLRSYVQAAVDETVDSIVPGYFTATLTYSLMYE
ncbi:MAG TPA: type 1 fimbrial protein [Providencia sp.]|uniref:fimbrial protein n=1 Tax=Providencia sp. TaxID=589 RepID=UPI000E82A1CB|nr:type 1 fimbrial protein [Providencia sp.]HBO24265.1 type 1 fimbrial protein [Providencia sp.]